nr:hypothetical protein [Actinomycetota bacterium]
EDHPSSSTDLRTTSFSSAGGFVAKWGSTGSGDGKFNSPRGIATDGTNVYVADSANNRVQKFSSAGGFVAKWGSAGSGDGQFNGPTGVTADTNFVLVADRGNHRIEAFYARNGNFTATWGTFGANNGQFKSPSGIAGCCGEFSYVADSGNNRIQRFDFTNFVAKWGRNGGDGSAGSGDGEFNNPKGVAIDQDYNVYVADTGNHRIQKFKPVQ